MEVPNPDSCWCRTSSPSWFPVRVRVFTVHSLSLPLHVLPIEHYMYAPTASRALFNYLTMEIQTPTRRGSPLVRKPLSPTWMYRDPANIEIVIVAGHGHQWSIVETLWYRTFNNSCQVNASKLYVKRPDHQPRTKIYTVQRRPVWKYFASPTTEKWCMSRTFPRSLHNISNRNNSISSI